MSTKSVPSLKPFIIYLEHNKHRLDNVQKLLSIIPNSQIFPAVDGRTVNFVMNNGNCFMTLGQILINHRPEIRPHLKMGYGEAACLMSHFCLWHYFAVHLKDDEIGFVMEDDAVCDDPVKFMENLNELPDMPQWDICELFTTTSIAKVRSITSKFFISTLHPFNRACSYLITKHGARKILESICISVNGNIRFSLDLPADDIISLLHCNNRVNVIFPEDKCWNHLERDRGWESSMWDASEAYLSVKWDRPLNSNWIGIDLGCWTGIGNQMFQYAAAKVQSLRLGMRLVVRASTNFQLNAFEYIRNFQEFTSDIPSGSGLSYRSAISIPIDHWNNSAEWKEQNLGYDSSILELKPGNNTRLNGYLQHIKYFEDYIPLFRMIFRFDVSIINKCQSILNEIHSTPTPLNGILDNDCISYNSKGVRGALNAPLVAVHIRLPNDGKEQLEEVCYAFPTEKFLYDSMDYMMTKFPDAHFVLCSNDIPRGKTIYNFGDRPHTWVDLGVFGDMQIMTMCDHFILSPSTFGWWSAMLCENPNKEVIMCRPFFGKKYNELNTYHDIIPKDWKTYDMEKAMFMK